jgi:hypothetical protein
MRERGVPTSSPGIGGCHLLDDAEIQQYVIDAHKTLGFGAIQTDLIGRAFDSLLKNSSYGQSFDLRLKSLRKAKLRFKQETVLYLAWQSRETFLVSQATLYTTQETFNTSQNTLSTTRETFTAIKETDANVRDLDRHVTTAVNELKEFLGDSIKNSECEFEVSCQVNTTCL